MITNKIQIGDLVLNDYTNRRPGNFTGWIQVLSVEGLDAPEVRRKSFYLATRDGILESNRYFGQRLITINGRIIGSNRSQLFSLEKDLKRIAMNVKIPPNEFLEFKYREEGETFERVIYCKPLGNYRRIEKIGDGNKHVWNFQFSLIAEDPLIYKNQTKTVEFIFSNATGLLIPTQVPFLINGPANSQIFLLENEGNIATGWKLRIYGIAQNVLIMNKTQNNTKIQTYLTINTNEYLEINYKDRTIKLNGVTNVYNSITLDSYFFEILPGINEIVVATELYNTTTKCTFEFRDAYI